jgi:hypothetical protein
VPRRCPTCHQLVDDDRLVACPNPQCPSRFSGTALPLPLSQDQVDRIVKAVTDDFSKSGPTLDKLAKPVAWRIFKNVHWWITLPVVYLALFGLSYYRIQTGLQELLISRVAKQFEEPRIRDTFQEVANTKASELLTNEIQPAVTQFRADLQNEYQAVSEEIELLKLQNNLPILSTKAISQGDREALEEILRIAQTAPENSPLKKIVP